MDSALPTRLPLDDLPRTEPAVPADAAALADPTGPVFGDGTVGEDEHDLTRQHAGEPLGERINVSGRVARPRRAPVRERPDRGLAGERGRPLHPRRRSPPRAARPELHRRRRCLTDDEGRYRFVTIKPGAYPWGNHPNAWRPAHIHFSLFGRLFTDRLVTQMYFPGDPLFPYDPIFQSVRDPPARERLICRFDLETTEPEWALGYRFDIVLGGAAATPIEDP